ncbi:ribonuclease HII [Roseibacillus persicicus]|uniref:ribonuclease HII n=1 Tax=Roseibacillus persicicus TaxID=454148 RepID=UPI00280C811A|nr:ribonuclease HII [Roseibacillus persicicus]MDQ8192161.1 ribonuclease HII [Roseibacillus persicicus]
MQFSRTVFYQSMPDDVYEQNARKRGFRFVIGIDEAGRGPLAGPVSVAAVRLGSDAVFEGLNDSKKLSEKKRELIFAEIMNCEAVEWSHSFAETKEIDEINILRATEAAMARTATQLSEADYALIDGRPVKGFPIASEGIVKGDSKSLSIAAASVIAKVLRDRRMVEWDAEYPEYGFAKHKGYGTKVHLEALRKYGPCPIHRRSFAPVAEAERVFGQRG